ncbi:caffeic acid 3-O-methyltransferase-like [Jatropha curcas]|uniref:caffeic acid 3-O-methyltransferase-like n=1 Tax=Jatropha curcas TaxID=180498 RepID=UPI001894581B|nr:caffeic acid 3-O-methyltransferase-like [Jatropha curcas]
MSLAENHIDEEACLNAMIFSSSHVFPFVLHTAIELNLFGIIAKAGPGAFVSASEIASQLPTTNPDAPSMLDRMLHLFASHSLLSYSSRTLKDGSIQKLYGLTPACKFFIGSVEEGNISSFSYLSYHRATVEVWLNMKDAILEGGNLFKKVHGMSVFEYMNRDPEFNNIFNQAMAGLSSVIMSGILAKYKGFEGLTSLVDVGGGTGRTLHMIISKYPSIKGINYDLPHVIQSAPPYAGIQHVGGNMFTGVPKGDAIMIKETCHNWSDDNVVRVLKNIYEVLPENGKLIILNALLPEEPETSKASQYVSRTDNLMLTQPGGKERTAREFAALTKAAGFTNFRVASVADGICAVMESYK